MWELTKSFRFEAAHSLTGTTFGAGGSEIHGHSFRAEVTVHGVPDPQTGMIVDLGLLDSKLVAARDALDHKLLDHINTLGPPTLENLARFIFDRLQGCGDITRVTVYRDSCGEACSYTGPENGAG